MLQTTDYFIRLLCPSNCACKLSSCLLPTHPIAKQRKLICVLWKERKALQLDLLKALKQFLTFNNVLSITYRLSHFYSPITGLHTSKDPVLVRRRFWETSFQKKERKGCLNFSFLQHFFIKTCSFLEQIIFVLTPRLSETTVFHPHMLRTCCDPPLDHSRPTAFYPTSGIFTARVGHHQLIIIFHQEENPINFQKDQFLIKYTLTPYIPMLRTVYVHKSKPC